MFQPVSPQVRFPELEERILAFWREHNTYQKSLERREGAPPFVFFEGPPTANGMPHPGHCLTRAIKDLFPRYRTMRGFRCERKAGWDTHGLPVEVEVCKELGIHSKEEIENYGIEPFIQKCQQSVWRYMQEWERLTERLGFWVDLRNAYVTYHESFVESVWWSLKVLFERGLLYQGHKIVWWWAQGGTALSSGEVGLGYREVADPSVYVKFPLLDEPGTSLLVWTTTPWTLPSNQFAAVHPELDYVTVEDEHDGKTERLIVAAALATTLGEKVKRELKVVGTCKGAQLLGKRYKPPFDYYYKSQGDKTGQLKSGGTESIAWRVVAADFVTTDSGTGVVHQAPAFGEVDYEVLMREQARFVEGQGPPLINAVGPDGKFTADAAPWRGRWVKEADKDISRDLKERGLLFHLDQYLHEYPFCWRADQDPLIQYPRKSWFIRTSQFKDAMVENNRQINWLPDHIRDGRFGNFLESNVDWALSRERYWGTPLPIWVCEKTGKMEAIGSYDELLAKKGVQGTEVWANAKKANPELVEDLKVHKPYIDAVTYASSFAEGARMRRVTEVIDCWYDSGAMPFAQWGYPHSGAKDFVSQFPADFISEAIDQTRGWFYSQLAISTLLFRPEGPPPATDVATPDPKYPHPFKNCIVLGLMLGEDGLKMSKQKRNYRQPHEIFDTYGADALRWYFFANQPPWTSIRYSERAIKDSMPEFLLRLWNVYSFFVNYANIDGFAPDARLAGDVGQLTPRELAKAKGYRPIGERAELDRWIVSELNRTAAAMVEKMDAYDNYGACGMLHAFVDALSNWYVRRSRDRFWSSDTESPEKLDATWTLYECLLTTSKLMAPFVPFLAEAIWQNLAGVFGKRAVESVHFCDYPDGQSGAIDAELSEQMGLVRDITSLGLRARMNSKLKVRQPLAKLELILADEKHKAWLQEHDGLLRDELNVEEIEYTQHAEKYISYEIQPNFKVMGPKVGKLLPGLKKQLGAADAAKLLAEMREQGSVTINVEGTPVKLDSTDLQVRLKAKEGWAAADGPTCVVVLATELTPALIEKGIVRDFVRALQDVRKDLNLRLDDRIAVAFETDSEEIKSAVLANKEYVSSETLCLELKSGGLVPNAQERTVEVRGSQVKFSVAVAT